MGNLLNFSVYNPAILDDRNFLAGFVARQTLAEELLNELRKHDAKNLARHQLIIGQRGMGKTSLLRRLALGVEQDPALAQVFIPLTFREEQYNVLNLRQFWINCLDALSNYFERAGKNELADEVDSGIAKVLAQPDDSDGEAALALLKTWSKREERRLLLLLDNIDFIFDGLDNQQGWRLRNVLQEPGGIVVAGAAAGFVEAAAKVDMPFYDFFHVTVLEKLSPEELVACLRTFAKKRGEEGVKVLNALDHDPARIRTLYDLTGGNPRTLVLLYVLLELNIDEDVMSDLERLLDQVTVMYKARVEDLALQARAVLDAIALHWDPISAAQVAQATGLENASVSSQLDRLVKLSIIEKTSLSTPSPTGYQLGERFFNIWYLMRHGPRRQRAKLRWLTQCLRGIYSPRQLADAATEFMKRPTRDRLSKGLFSLALSEAVAEPWLCDLLNHYGTRELERHTSESRTLLESIGVEISDLHGSTHEMAELEHQVKASPRDWGSVTAQEFWENLGGCELSKAQKKQIIEGLDGLSVSQVEELVRIFQEEKRRLHELTELPEAVDRIWQAVGAGLMMDWADFRAALGLAKHEANPTILVVALGFCSRNYVGSLKEGEQSLTQEILAGLFSSPAATELNGDAWGGYGDFLVTLGKFPEAEAAYRKVIELDPKYALAWNSLGELLTTHLGRHEEAEAAYRKAIELDPEFALAWNSLGSLLTAPLGRHEEAEAAYRKAIEFDQEFAWSWSNLGGLLTCHLGRHEEAENAYRKAIDLDPEYSTPWGGLGNLLQDHLGRTDEAEQAYAESLKFEEGDVPILANLAYLLFSQPARREEAEQYFQAAVEKLPPHGAALLRSYRALAGDNFGEATENLASALESNHPEIFDTYYDDLLRTLRLAAERGYGEKLLAWLDESGFGDRYWPFRAAFDAYLHGEAKLREVNPEVRGAASRIYAWLDSRRAHLARLQPVLPTTAKRGRRKSSAALKR